jgi:hypothetical protein
MKNEPAEVFSWVIALRKIFRWLQFNLGSIICWVLISSTEELSKHPMGVYVSLDVCIGWLPVFDPLKGGDDLFFEPVNNFTRQHPAR